MHLLKRFAIMADIDDNKFAIISILQYIEKYFKVGKVFNLGDFVHIVPHLNQWVQLIFKLLY